MQVDEVVDIMKVNVDAILKRDEELRRLDNTASIIEEGAQDLADTVSRFLGEKMRTNLS